jgi:hypothetical protein
MRRMIPVLCPGLEPGRIHRLQLPSESGIEGVVLDRAGRGISGAQVRAIRLDEAWVEFPEALLDEEGSEWKDAPQNMADGSFRVGRLASVAHWVIVRPPPEFCWPKPVLANPGGAPLRIALDPARRAAVSVVDERGAAVVGAVVVPSSRPWSINRGERLGDFTDSVTTDERGVALLSHLEATVRCLAVMPPRGRRDLIEFTQDGWEPFDRRIVLSPGLPVSGVVRDSSGRAVDQAVVTCKDASGVLSTTRTRDDGSFEFLPLPIGSVEVSARGGVDDGSSVEVTAEANDVSLVVPSGNDLIVRIEGLSPGWRARWAFATIRGDDGFEIFIIPEPVVTVPRLDPRRTYTLLLRDTPESSAFMTGVRGDAKTVTLRMSSGRTIRGRVRIPSPGSGLVSVQADVKGIIVRGHVEDDGTYEIHSLPQGSWAVEASVYYKRMERKRVTRNVEAGTIADFELPP